MSFAFTAAKFLALLRHYSSRPYLTPAQKTVRSLLSAKPEKTFEISEATEIASYKLPHRRVCRIHGCYTNFLKHYEECGLLDVHHRENGYRYFNFDQCSRILEYMRLRNYNRIKTLQREISRLANQTRNAKHFLTVPGVGDTIMAYMCVLLADPTQFSSGRQFAAYLGLVPMHTGSGGKTVTTKIPGRCDKALRALLVQGAHAVARSKYRTDWVKNILAKKPKKVAMVAIANRMARQCWAVASKGQDWRRMPVTAA